MEGEVLMSDRSRWLIYKCNVCNHEIARQLEDQDGNDVETNDATTEILLTENKVPLIHWGIRGCWCDSPYGVVYKDKPLCDENGNYITYRIRPSYTLIAHCTEKDLSKRNVKRDTIKVKISV